MQRYERERPSRQPWMRNLQVRFIDDEIAEEKDVEVEGARAVAKPRRAVASKFVFDGQQRFEQRARRQLGFKRHGGIHEARLIGESNRLGGVQRGAGRDASERSEPQGCRGERSRRRSRRAG